MKDKMHGVFKATKKNGDTYYRASLTHKGKHISLGSFSTPEEAHQAYIEGNAVLTHPNMVIENYRPESFTLPFEKLVSLINYRDNDIYIANPIIIKQKYFYYYLSPDHILKFDMDDLFFYSSHKIMARGNHYFVAQYGPQVNIADRYGIMNYAVIGRDYDFLNNDPTDFRRANIRIYNSYRGVRIPPNANIRRGKNLYSTYIHIKGDYLVGKYPDAITAAIAYNKAVDILRKKGLKKNFDTNYLDNVSPREYAEIYSRIKISPKILEYKIDPAE